MDFSQFGNIKAILFVAGGVAAVLLTVVIKISNRKRTINNTRKTIEDAIQREPLLRSKYGNDLNEYFSNNSELRDLKFWNEIVLNAIQPLLLLAILILFDYRSTLSVVYLLGIIIFSFAHEMFFGEEYASKGGYRFLILALWIIFYLITCYDMNSRDQATGELKSNTNQTHLTSLYNRNNTHSPVFSSRTRTKILSNFSNV